MCSRIKPHKIKINNYSHNKKLVLLMKSKKNFKLFYPFSNEIIILQMIVNPHKKLLKMQILKVI